MSRKLLLLNLVLAVLVAIVGTRARDNWLEAQKRADVVLSKRVPVAAAPPFTPLVPPERAHAGSFADIAQQTLFSPDRNPTVVVEVAPPKPMPPLPVMYGVMNLGEGPVAMMAEKPGASRHEVHAGSTIGEFKIVSLSMDEIALQWEDKRMVKKPADLVDRSGAQTAAEAAKAKAVAAKPAAPAPAPAQARVASASGPGGELGGGNRQCQPGDNSPAGTVMDGYRKIVRDTPFGKSCFWAPAQ